MASPPIPLAALARALLNQSQGDAESFLQPAQSRLNSQQGQPYGPDGTIPTPQVDPRTWAQRLPRIQDAQGLPLGVDVLPPSVLLYGQGIDPTRKHGDAIDYDANHMAAWLNQNNKWKKDI